MYMCILFHASEVGSLAILHLGSVTVNYCLAPESAMADNRP